MLDVDFQKLAVLRDRHAACLAAGDGDEGGGEYCQRRRRRDSMRFHVLLLRQRNLQVAVPGGCGNRTTGTTLAVKDSSAWRTTSASMVALRKRQLWSRTKPAVRSAPAWPDLPIISASGSRPPHATSSVRSIRPS